MREGDGCSTSSSLPRHRSFFARSVSTRTTSPGSTKGVRITLPSRRANPSPPYTSFSIVSVSGIRVSSMGKRKGIMIDQAWMFQHEGTRVFRRSADRQFAYWELSGCAEELGRDSGQLREHLRHRRFACHHGSSRASRAALEDSGDGGAVSGGGHRPEALDHCRAVV